MTIGDVLRMMTGFQKDLNDSIFDKSEEKLDNFNEHLVLHKAAGVLRNHIANVKVSNEYYEMSSQIATDHCARFVPDVLYDFILWLLYEKAYFNVDSCSVVEDMMNNINVIDICHSIIAKSKDVITPVTLGLGLYIHHEFGSSRVIQEISRLGFSVSYDEVRRFLTSAMDQQDSDIYIPRGLMITDNCQIDAAIDNFDQNEETLDGKLTTHALAAVLYQQSAEKLDVTVIPRVYQEQIPSE